MKRILLNRFLRPRRHGPPSDHSYSSRETAPSSSRPFDTAPSETTSSAEASIDQSSHSNISVQESSSAMPGTHVAKATRKRKRRRRNEYDFGPKRKKSKKKAKPKTEMSDSDPNSLVKIKELYQNSDEKKLKDSLFVDAENIPKKVTRISKSQELSNQTVPRHTVTPGLSQTTCCQFFKSRKGNGNTERAYRRKNGLWKKGDRCSQRLVVKNFKFPFHELPLECKMKIFDWLDPVCKGIAAQVCQDWYDFVNDADTWRNIDLDFLCSGLTCQLLGAPTMRKATARARYDVVKARMGSFAAFTNRIKPRLESLAFQFDIGNYMDNWYSHIEALLQDCELKRLKSVSIDWQNTPGKPSCLETYCCIFNKARVLFKLHLYRVHVFHRMLDILTRGASNVLQVSMPFDWSAGSVLLLSRWRELTSVKMLPYLSMRGIEQSLLDVFLRSHPKLQHLHLAVCVPLYTNTAMFKISHSKLETLDLSSTKGFYLNHIDLPNLREIKLSSHPWKGVILSADNQDFVPCMYNLMVKGLPRLEAVNKHSLTAFWKEFEYEELQLVLKKVCICARHYAHEAPAPNN